MYCKVLEQVLCEIPKGNEFVKDFLIIFNFWAYYAYVLYLYSFCLYISLSNSSYGSHSPSNYCLLIFIHRILFRVALKYTYLGMTTWDWIVYQKTCTNRRVFSLSQHLLIILLLFTWTWGPEVFLISHGMSA